MIAETPLPSISLPHEPRPKKTLPKGGGTLGDLVHFMQTQTILDKEELSSFMNDVEDAHRKMNQIPKSSWDT